MECRIFMGDYYFVLQSKRHRGEFDDDDDDDDDENEAAAFFFFGTNCVVSA
eukprot:CAMPEP_0170914016 /NCGR_PEP_ID=MMETSP0735-20130129/5329_1 /TAXON_ID=186038 /ORGANISM="Fragilariopsis kerguelensis, Strain L26-C5" /LENGTH=50 /DNA_ID=CAMNT_0011311609 /DNA_START=141 /DNA_END=289 /DNA_ORIENTATION=-